MPGCVTSGRSGEVMTYSGELGKDEAPSRRSCRRARKRRGLATYSGAHLDQRLKVRSSMAKCDPLHVHTHFRDCHGLPPDNYRMQSLVIRV